MILFFFKKKLALDNTKYYQILNVDKDASPKTIRKAYQKFFRYHPGKGPDPEIYKEIHNAYEVLSDPKKKGKYMINMVKRV